MSDQVDKRQVRECLDWSYKFFNVAIEEIRLEYTKAYELLKKNQVTFDSYNPRLGVAATLKAVASKIENGMIKPR